MADTPATFRTFRDPAGSVEVLSDRVCRFVKEPYARAFQEFLASPAADKLTATGKLIPSTVLGADTHGVHLEHPRVPFISYPWEWTAAMWQASAELTLDVCTELLTQGWLLKDATPLNVLFLGSKPILVDVLSIEKASPGETMWQAYGQFVRTFLLPLIAHSWLGWPLQTSQIRRDGFEPEEVFSALGWSQRLRAPARSAVTLPIILSKLKTESASVHPGSSETLSRKMDADIARKILLRRLAGLGRSLRKALPQSRNSAWKQYAERATHYSDEEHARKKQFIGEALLSVKAATVLDIGCNTGNYSRLAAEHGAQVVSIDSDMQALERLYKEAHRLGQDILPLCVDIAYPSPAFGWENRETLSFLTRCEGRFDTVLMLAVIHHLLLSNQIPLPEIASLISRITTKALILEWVPPTDVKFVEVLRGRGELYQHLTESAMRQAFSTYFAVVSEEQLANGRILLHMEKR